MRFCNKHILFDLSSRLASNDTIGSVLRRREVGRAKDLSAPLAQIHATTIIRPLDKSFSLTRYIYIYIYIYMLAYGFTNVLVGVFTYTYF